jgi:hypothetical protein
MAKILCVEYTAGDYPVRLFQTGFDRFTVEYGKQVKRTMSYSEAGAEFGLCVMHSASCAGKLDNRTAAEGREAGDHAPYIQAEN